MDDGGDGRFRYIRGWSTAGFIAYLTSGERRFIPLWPDFPTSFPTAGTVCASTRGLILTHFPDAVTVDHPYAYIVNNPYIHGSTRCIPNPNPLHENRIPRVLVVYVHPVSHLRVFHIVCALLEGHHSPSYKFDVYSSNTDRWNSWRSYDLGFLREDTGVSCGTKAYWLRRDAPMAAYYDTETNSVGNIGLPDDYVWLFSQPDNLRSQIGTLRNQLCVVVSTEDSCAVYTAGAGGGWVCNGQGRIGNTILLPVLSRFQDYRLQVPFWLGGGAFDVWDSSWVNYSRPERVSLLRGPPPDFSRDILPLVHKRLNPVLDFPRFPA